MGIFKEMSMEEFEKRLLDNRFREILLEAMNSASFMSMVKKEATNSWNTLANEIISQRYMEEVKNGL